jgi:hypothetical protein
VLTNHIYENKIGQQRLWPFLLGQQEFAFKTLFELSMLQDEVIHELMAQPVVLQCVLSATNASNETLRKYALRVVGNIATAKEEYVSALLKAGILDALLPNLSCSNPEVRRDVCWVVSNLSARKNSATAVIQHSQIIAKLVELFGGEAVLSIKKELSYLFAYLAHYADRSQALQLLSHPNVLEICYGQLCEEDTDLNLVTLLLLKELLELGDNFKYEEGQNLVLKMMQQARALSSEISKKSYS